MNIGQVVSFLVFGAIQFKLFATATGHPYRSQGFRNVAVNVNADKVTLHRYDSLYQKYLENHRLDEMKLLEIGLGCSAFSSHFCLSVC